ncbi:phosphomannose isomerase [Trypanosoma grayi]|uniref:phosphomannose isomerase n=1 Tax=Trypanosoma grayi TaxID=71804 RepID=UPI0004F4AA91|nr:phosphomannose isomerase [Trypanosoma grayi]KEG15386.1 phosphomannose isomerase [Trypanosoma grayi]
MTELVRLECGVQHYDWGKSASDSFIAKMKHVSSGDKKYAELWVGTHPNCPSRTQSGQLLSEYIANPTVAPRFLSASQQRHPEFRNSVPFLLKVLSIQTALSIQAHPNKALAQKLHLDNPTKYKDPNHKPELIVALTPFEALCCFRPLCDILRLVRKVPPLSTLLGCATEFPAGNSEKDTVKSMMSLLYNLDAERHTKALREHVGAVMAQGDTASTEDRLFVRLMSQYPDDIGCWMVYFLNYVQMEPGQGLFLADSEPHAYIYGDGVEIMASSDNVVRAGLTPKWKDVPTLLDMLSYNTKGLQRAKYERQRAQGGLEWEVQHYCPPREFPEFSLYRIEHTAQTAGSASVTLPTIGLGFCLGGEGFVNGTRVVKGDCFAVPYGQVKCEAERNFLVFVASMNTSVQQMSRV